MIEAKEYIAARHYYVWKTEQPDLKFTRESQTFSLKCVKWHFKLSALLNTRNEELWDLCMVYESEPKVMWNVTTYVKDKNGTLDLLCTTGYSHIYNEMYHENKCPNILTRMDTVKLQMNKHKYLQNGKITFVIILDELVKTLFDVKRNSFGKLDLTFSHFILNTELLNFN